MIYKGRMDKENNDNIYGGPSLQVKHISAILYRNKEIKYPLKKPVNLIAPARSKRAFDQELLEGIDYRQIPNSNQPFSSID